ncbi:peptide deformylase [Variovorax sp. PBL-E5]|uniref:peptide deformylase n=1 Tax=Variovorax sp. PBL-E5 TaxID=434014 RepID=UPI001315D5F7|nr:peptide deformylase [Variovorax sp. PBL-E5]VTU22279.1 Peptide deformylase [Variovorax sp. PBL-E5]
MAVRSILKMGNPALTVVSEPVADPSSPGIRALIDDMRETLDSVAGIGLAAPQIGTPLRVVLYALPASRIPAHARTQPVPWTPLINPVITPLTDRTVNLWERCLSLPGLYARVPRHPHIMIRWQSLDGQWNERECRGYHATLLAHECDHLDGVLYPARMPDASALAFASEVCGPRGVYTYSAAEFDGDDAS